MAIYGFTTPNYYIKYKLYDQLNAINSTIFNSSYPFLVDKTLSATGLTYYDGRPNADIYPTTYADTKGTLIKVTPTILSDTNYFRKNTFVNLNSNGYYYKTLIVDLVPDEYFVIETYKSNTGLTFSSINTIYNLKDISDLLYDVYINEESSYYRVRDDNRRRDICNAYADFISSDINVIDYVTAFLLQDKDHKFILKIYDPENVSNGGVSRNPTVATLPAENITSMTASLYGQVLDTGGENITERGIYYGLTIIPDRKKIEASQLSPQPGEFFSNVGEYLSWLDPETTYYYKAYAINKGSAEKSFGNVLSFKTTAAVISAPMVVTIGLTKLNSHRITVSGEVTHDGYLPIISRGIVYEIGNVADPSTFLSGVTTTGQIGPYSCEITGLTHSTGYTYAAFATNSTGTSYGSTGYTTTSSPLSPVVNTGGNNATYDTINVIGQLISTDDETTTELGICMSSGTTTTPTISNTCITASISFSPYTCTFTGLTGNNTYYFRTYVKNAYYTAYGSTISVLTDNTPVDPTITINSTTPGVYDCVVITTITNGYLPLTSQKLYYSTTDPATTSDPYVDGVPSNPNGGTNTFTISSLSANMTYYILIKAINSLHTGTTTHNFTTNYLPILPTLDLPVINDITTTGATVYNGILNAGYATITAKGVAYNTTSSPTTPTIDGGTGTSDWMSYLTGLIPSTTYYVRTYATNSVDTGRSSPDVYFTTDSLPPPTNGTLSGITSNYWDGSLISNVVVDVLASDSSVKYGTSGVNGVYSIADVYGGPITGTSTTSYYDNMTKTDTITSNGLGMNFAMYHYTGTTSGITYDNCSNDPVSGVTITIQNNSTITNNNGEYSLTGQTGYVSINVIPPSMYNSNSIGGDIIKDSLSNYDITLIRNITTLNVTVVSGITSLSGATITLTDIYDTFILSGKTDINGLFTTYDAPIGLVLINIIIDIYNVNDKLTLIECSTNDLMLQILYQ